MSATQEQINRLKNNVQATLSTIADTGVAVGTNSDALPAAAAALANEKQNKILKVSIPFSATWTASGSNYTQTVTVDGGTANSLISLQPTAAQIVALQEAGVTALMVDNNNGTFVATAVSAKPTAAMTIQATLMEVST